MTLAIIIQRICCIVLLNKTKRLLNEKVISFGTVGTYTAYR